MHSPAASLPRYVVRLSGALAALLGGAEGAELLEDDFTDGMKVAGLITYPSPPTAQHHAPVAQAAVEPPAAAAAAEHSTDRRVTRLSAALAALLGYAEGAELSEDELLAGLTLR